MIINYQDKYTDFKLFYLKKMLKILYNFRLEIKTKRGPGVSLNNCPYDPPSLHSGLCPKGAGGQLQTISKPYHE
jgi:hypothetical protein